MPDQLIEFVLKGNWQVLKEIVTECVNAFRPSGISGWTYVGVDPSSTNDSDWFVSVEATVFYKGRARTGKVGQVEALAFGDDRVLVRLVPVEIFAESVAPFFDGLLKEARARRLVEEEGAHPNENDSAQVSNSRRLHLMHRYQELQTPLKIYNQRIEAIQCGIALELDGEERVVMEARLQQVLQQREATVAEIQKIEQELNNLN